MKIFCFFLLMSIYSLRVAACGACGFGQDESRWAFILTTVIMTFVPLVVIGSCLFVLRRRFKNQINNP